MGCTEMGGVGGRRWGFCGCGGRNGGDRGRWMEGRVGRRRLGGNGGGRSGGLLFLVWGFSPRKSPSSWRRWRGCLDCARDGRDGRCGLVARVGARRWWSSGDLLAEDGRCSCGSEAGGLCGWLGAPSAIGRRGGIHVLPLTEVLRDCRDVLVRSNRVCRRQVYAARPRSPATG